MAIQPMLARRQIRLAVLAALQGANLQAAIETPGDSSTAASALPTVLLRASRSNKEPILRGPPEYTTTVVIEIESRISGKTETEAQDLIDALDFNIEQAIFTNQGLIKLTQQMFVDTETEITNEGRTHLAGTKWAIRVEVAEMFDPVFDAPASMQPVTVPLQGMDIHADLIGTFDANGNYPPGVFSDAISPAPRVSGPDGRDEGSLNINFPQ